MSEKSDIEKMIEADRLRTKLEKDMKSTMRWMIVGAVLSVISLGLQIFRIIMRVKGVWE